MGKRRFTDEQEQEICRRYLAGESLPQLGAGFDVTAATIRNVLDRHGIKRRSMLEAKKGLFGKAEEDACRRYANGESAHRLGKEFGVTPATVARAVQRNGITMRNRSQARGGLPCEVEPEICRRYVKGESAVALAACYDCSSVNIVNILKRHGVERRNRAAAQGGLEDDAVADVCRRYLKGETGYSLAADFGVTFSTIYAALKRNGIERRISNGYNDSVQHVLDCTGNHVQARECEFYLFELARYSNSHCKPGIAFDVDVRVGVGDGEYGAEALRLVFATRQEAYFLEQAVLDATRAFADCPADLRGWIGASEVRAMSAAGMEPIVLRLADELEELGVWEFAARFVPMTAAQRLICQQRAMAADALTEGGAG